MTTKLRLMANAIRILAIDAIAQANSGHPGIALGMADVVSILFAEFLKFNPKSPHWPNRDRFILSAGHGSILLYSILYLCGYEDIALEDLQNFRKLHSKTPGHPEYKMLQAIETTTGPLGQGLANAVGIAIANEMLALDFPGIINNKTYVLAGDGCLMEGISHEAISIAGHLKLKNLILLFDDNKVTIDGFTNLTTSDDQILRFQAANWHTITIDGHDFTQISSALTAANKSDKPTIIACKTIIGFGSPGSASCKIHGKVPTMEELIAIRSNLNWQYQKPFYIPAEILQDFNNIAIKHLTEFEQWYEKYQLLDNKIEFDRRITRELPKNLSEIFQQLKNSTSNQSQATRQCSGIILNSLSKILPELIGGSADLTPSNNTKYNDAIAIKPGDFSGKYIHYGIREHAMAAIMNGLALSSFIPYGGTFLVFSDYCRHAIRLSALMQQRVIYVMTHDSIGVGEDGPTHQPIEHLASLRAIPNLLLFRPADMIETIECWQLAIENKHTPTILALSRQNVPLVRNDLDNQQNKCQKGGYIIQESNLPIMVTFLATGSELQLAIKASEILTQQQIGCRVISMVCWSLFEQQPEEYKNSLLSNNSLKIGIEAGVRLGWDRYIGYDGIFIGMKSFGASAKAEDLYNYFGINVENIVNAVLQKLKIGD